jgi:Family of unknown function (DUF6314)
VLAYLRGLWRVHRDLHEHGTGRRGVFVGEASVDGCRYVERGELMFGAHRGAASRVHLYEQLAEGVLDVRFADGRAFYRLQLVDGGWRAEHPCAEDLYTVVGRITGPDRFTELWRADGPTTGFTSHTTFSRIAPRSATPA